MNNKLAITVLGNPNSGKTETWKILFDKDVRTGSHIRRLYLNTEEYLDVFLVSGSAEERGIKMRFMKPSDSMPKERQRFPIGARPKSGFARPCLPGENPGSRSGGTGLAGGFLFL